MSGAGPDDLVIEIGPGGGILTDALARRAGTVVAYEKDPRYADRLHNRYRDNPQVHCFHRDFLSTSPPRRDFLIVANIPYSVTAGIVNWCLAAPRMRTATLLTQLEYARKHTGDYGRWSRLTVLNWPRFDWKLLGRVGRDHFHPRPRVNSGILSLRRRDRPLVPEATQPDWQRFVELGFTGVGGTLHASLRRRYGRRAVDAGFSSARLPKTTVVGQVTPDQWLALFGRIMRL